MVYPGTLFHRRQRGIPMHSYENRSQIRALRSEQTASRLPSEKDADLAQKLGQLQPFLAAIPRQCMGQLASFGPT